MAMAKTPSLRKSKRSRTVSFSVVCCSMGLLQASYSVCVCSHLQEEGIDVLLYSSERACPHASKAIRGSAARTTPWTQESSPTQRGKYLAQKATADLRGATQAGLND